MCAEHQEAGGHQQGGWGLQNHDPGDQVGTRSPLCGRKLGSGCGFSALSLRGTALTDEVETFSILGCSSNQTSPPEELCSSAGGRANYTHTHTHEHTGKKEHNWSGPSREFGAPARIQPVSAFQAHHWRPAGVWL
uniref:Uncharacterized protein n=1 Tax=Myotis myotis TaxID=51298 RepID=A0A7J7ZYE4_MYOMY|nr:hypothetical protein mMyoMyo1_009980 [Myotis myotis]